MTTLRTTPHHPVLVSESTGPDRAHRPSAQDPVRRGSEGVYVVKAPPRGRQRSRVRGPRDRGLSTVCEVGADSAVAAPWPRWLLVALLTASGLSWAFSSTPAPLAGPALLAAAVTLAGAWGVARLHPWGWSVAVLYAAAGAVSLAMHAVALVAPLGPLPPLHPAAGLLALPYLVRRRWEFF